MNKLTAFLITFIAGFLFILGVVIIKKVHNKKLVYTFSSSLAFSVIICLLLFDIIPEIFELFNTMGNNKRIIYFLGCTLIGIIILKIMDSLIPVHTHHHNDKEKNLKEHNAHLFHIGLITSVALIIHNIIEGMAIYSVSLASLKSGLLMGLGVALHNIPMGMEISLTLDMSSKSINKVITYGFLVLSPLLGGLFIAIFNNINSIFLGILMCITCGMLIYISFFELFGEVRNNIKKKETVLGLILGLILMSITVLL